MTELTDPTQSENPPVGIVVAMTQKLVIGQSGQIPWDLPEDRRLFRHLTLGSTVIMGRRTFESLPGALDSRHNLVVSHSVPQQLGITVCASFCQALDIGQHLAKPVFIIGGVELYRLALPIADTLYISWVKHDYCGDRYFPTFDPSLWQPMSSSDYPGFLHVVYRRKIS